MNNCGVRLAADGWFYYGSGGCVSALIWRENVCVSALIGSQNQRENANEKVGKSDYFRQKVVKK
jgi:hypothetical protein